MATKSWTCVIALFLLMVVSTSSRDPIIGHGQKRIVAKTWCIAKPGLSQTQMATAIGYYCQQPGVNCDPVKPGGSCYVGTVQDHLSFALDSYYAAHNKISPYCPSDVGYWTVNNPSTGSCVYP